jgi:hypothetical protein
MKKIILIITALIFMSEYSNAQRDCRGKLYLGLKIGANLSNVYDSQSEKFNANSKFGWVAGSFLAIPAGRYLGLQPELLFSQKGFRATESISGTDYQFTRTTNFIDLPLFITLKPTTQLTLLAGPQFSYLMKRRDVFANSVQQNQFAHDNIRKNIMCFIGGLDFNFNHLLLGARFGWDVTQNNGNGTSAAPQYKNVWYQASLGYRFFY